MDAVPARFLVPAVLVLALLAGCTGPSGSGSVSADGAGGAVAPVTAVPGSDEIADPDRQVVTTAATSLAVADPADAAQRVSELVESVGGRVDERTVQATSGADGAEGVVADLVVRVPADALTGVLADLEELGDVEDVSVSRSDVTATAVDLDARISALQASVTRLLALMADAATTEALLEAERALSQRQQELESLQSRRAALADQVELSTLRVHLERFGVAPAGGPDGFLDGLATGWRSLVAVVGGTVVVLGVVLPWLVLTALVAAAVVVPLRRARRRAATPSPAAATEG
ncbi:DUF4349 domain-containing protein [Blastococcus sp. SYSU DS0533]